MKAFDRDSRINGARADGRSSAGLSRGSKFRNQANKVGPNHFMAYDPPMPQNSMERVSTTGFVRTAKGGDRDDIVSVISQARSLLSEGRLNASANGFNLQGTFGNQGQID